MRIACIHTCILPSIIGIGFVLAGLGRGARADDAKPLRPLMLQSDAVLCHDDFETPRPLDAKVWEPRQQTRWAIEGGVLKGLPATKEFQQSRDHDNGVTPHMKLHVPQDYIIEFSFKMEGGEPGKKQQAFFEFGHHMTHVQYNEAGTRIVLNREHRTLKSAPDLKIMQSQWYHVLAEIKGDELVVQIAAGPTLYAKDAKIGGERDGFGIIGRDQGTLLLDNVTVWSIKPDPQPQWPQTRLKLAADGKPPAK